MTGVSNHPTNSLCYRVLNPGINPPTHLSPLLRCPFFVLTARTSSDRSLLICAAYITLLRPCCSARHSKLLPTSHHLPSSHPENRTEENQPHPKLVQHNQVSPRRHPIPPAPPALQTTALGHHALIIPYSKNTAPYQTQSPPALCIVQLNIAGNRTHPRRSHPPMTLQYN